MTVAPEFQGEAFKRYIDYLGPIARAVSRRRSRDGHSLVSREDQAAYALEVCLRVWLTYQRRRPGATPEDLYPIAVTAMDRRLRQRRRSSLKCGESEVRIVPLSSPAYRGGNSPVPSVGDTLRAPEPPPGDVAVTRLWNVRRVAVLREMRPDEWAVLRELVQPSRATLDACYDIWQSPEQRRLRWNWPNVRIRAVAAGLGWGVERARATYRRMRASIVATPGNPLTATRSLIEGVEIIHTYQEERDMGTQGSAPSDPGATASASAPEAKAKRPKRGEPKTKAPAGERTPLEKLSTKAAVEYAGGSRIDGKKLRAGTRGVVRRVWPGHLYYGVDFGSGGKKHYHVLAARFVHSVAEKAAATKEGR